MWALDTQSRAEGRGTFSDPCVAIVPRADEAEVASGEEELSVSL